MSQYFFFRFPQSASPAPSQPVTANAVAQMDAPGYFFKISRILAFLFFHE